MKLVTVFIPDKSVTVINSNNFDLPNHEFYLLHFERGENEIPVGIIKRKLILNNSNMYKYNIIFILEDLVINYELFSPYKQLKRID
jgi:hypothetical protein